MLGNLTGLVAFICSLGLMYFLVPGKAAGRLFWMGLIGGFGVAIVLNLIAQNLLAVWRFYDVDLVSVYGAPLFLSAVWGPLVITFCHLFTKSSNFYITALLIGGFSAVTSLAHWFMIIQGTLVYENWSLLATFLLAVGLHAAIGYYRNLAEEAQRASFR